MHNIFSESEYFQFLRTLVHPGNQVALVIDPFQRITINAINRGSFKTESGESLLPIEIIPLNAAGQPMDPKELAFQFKRWEIKSTSSPTQ